MVVALGPGKFYGSSLPRPRIYSDVKFNTERVDPPLPVTAPLLSWAQEAHWSMGGLSFQRHRLQGRIEGNINRLRSQKETAFKKGKKKEKEKEKEVPGAPVAVKRKRRLIDEDEEEEEEEEEVVEYQRRTVRKLKDEFDEVATRQSPVKSTEPEKEEVVVQRGGLIGRRLIKGLKGISNSASTRTSPRRARSMFT